MTASSRRVPPTRAAVGRLYLWELVPDLSDPLALLPDDGAMEPLLDDQVLGALIFLNTRRRGDTPR